MNNDAEYGVEKEKQSITTFQALIIHKAKHWSVLSSAEERIRELPLRAQSARTRMRKSAALP